MDDLISRQATIDAILAELTKRERKNLLHTWSTVEVKYFVADMLEKLPSVQSEYSLDEWCTDCKEYDQKKHCCPRFNRVIRETVEEVRQNALSEQRWIPCSERMPEKYIGEWLCCTDDGQVLVLPYDTPGDGSKECVFYRWDDDGYMYETYNVVAWMPLPQPYKGERKDDERTD